MAQLNLLNRKARFTSMWLLRWCVMFRSPHPLLDFVHFPLIIQTLHFRGMFSLRFPYLKMEKRRFLKWCFLNTSLRLTKINKIAVLKIQNLKYLNESFLTEDIITNIQLIYKCPYLFHVHEDKCFTFVLLVIFIELNKIR